MITQKERVIKYFKFHSKIYDVSRWAFLLNREDAIEALKLEPGMTVLEIGCGTGLNFSSILKRIGNNGILIGLDYSQEMLAKSKKKIEKFKWQNVKLLCEDAENFNLSIKFNAILYSYSISMVSDWESSVMSSINHLKEGGRLVILDFYGFQGWGMACERAITWWLNKNHVSVNRNYEEFLSSVFANLELKIFKLGYNFIAVGRL
ncbi:MAG: phosphatidylethanolamine N-methyltransferase [Candidatus Scalindua rubra]|uniref:Phosphatidylethanolamine N-methyltransferase n=1 Tax=Candidatus Scalindua rubra TaxID=1872076 RepID=A0A1E3X7A6_9BACT|nr:MAG: phosphatidylethanolamine N-methyltransferase [Candidatus Scalindua rubra]